MKILIIHNVFWSHYKAAVFSEFFKICNSNNVELEVLHIALNEKGRGKLGNIDFSIHKYPYKILYNKELENVNFLKRVSGILKEIFRFKPDIIVIPGWNDISY